MTAQSPSSGLASALRAAKNAQADRQDVVVELREGQMDRLEMLAEELKPVFADVPADDERFDFVISSGLQPRLWVDAVAHVAMARDRRTYRFLRDTRLGRVVLCESTDIGTVAARVTGYIAERMVERERALEGPPIGLREASASDEARGNVRRRGSGVLKGLGVLLLGGLAGGLIVLAIAWERLAHFAWSF